MTLLKLNSCKGLIVSLSGKIVNTGNFVFIYLFRGEYLILECLVTLLQRKVYLTFLKYLSWLSLTAIFSLESNRK